jgi:hypothetical protein
MSASGQASRLGLFVITIALSALVVTPGRVFAQDSKVTFSKDVAPILQQKCQVCHRPGTSAPMSLLTYQDARPWVRAIRKRVSERTMPPWHLDRTIGIQQYKNDRSLTDQQVASIVTWADSGAVQGDPRDLPPPMQFRDEDEWAIGEPDLIIKAPPVKLYATGKGPADWTSNFTVPTGLTEDRYVKAVETKPSKGGRFAVHHANVTVTQQADEFMSRDSRASGDGRVTANFSEYVTGKYGDVFSEGSGRLLKAGSEVTFSTHYFVQNEEAIEETALGIKFYPRGYVPKYVSRWLTVEPGDDNELQIPPGQVIRTDAFFRLTKPTRIDGFQPHMHMRGKAQCLIAVHPYTPSDTVNALNTRGETQQEVLACVDRFDFNWQVAYVFADDAAPLLPAGTILHAISVFDNTAANPNNPDPKAWVSAGARSIDEMGNSHITAVFLEEADYQRMVAERKAKTERSTQQQQQ